MHALLGIPENPRERLAPGSLWAALVILLFGLVGCQPAAPNPGGDDSDCPTGPCGSDVEDPGGGDGGDPDDGGAGGANPDMCAEAAPVSGEIEFAFDNSAATLDGPAHGACVNHNQDQIDRDIWLCWTAECTSLAVAQTCGLTELDTRIAVYEGCECPPTSQRLLDCEDDDCGVQTRALFDAVAGRQYLIRLGTFPPGTEGGPGAVSVSCGFENCPGEGACGVEHGGLGCSDESCCNAVCAVDSVCCLDNWDDVCVQEASALCNGGFNSCVTGVGPCTVARTTPGCSDGDCCNLVCQSDTYCCLTEWDDECVMLEARTCFSACSTGAGDCATAHADPGCSDRDCCAEVCPRDQFCCITEWDAGCAALAAQHCGQ